MLSFYFLLIPAMRMGFGDIVFIRDMELKAIGFMLGVR